MTKNQFNKSMHKLRKLELEVSTLRSKLKFESRKLYDECVALMLKAEITHYWCPRYWVNLHKVQCSDFSGENTIIYSLSYTSPKSPMSTRVIEGNKVTSLHIDFLLELKENLLEK